jgi:hypothetical protein
LLGDFGGSSPISSPRDLFAGSSKVALRLEAADKLRHDESNQRNFQLIKIIALGSDQDAARKTKLFRTLTIIFILCYYSKEATWIAHIKGEHMKKYYLLAASMLLWASVAFVSHLDAEFEKVPDSAEYKGASWDNLVKIATGLTLDQAYEIAKSDPNITYFFHTIGYRLILDTPKGVQIFGYGDTAFFSGKPWWGTAPGLADGYMKK